MGVEYSCCLIEELCSEQLDLRIVIDNSGLQLSNNVFMVKAVDPKTT